MGVGKEQNIMYNIEESAKRLKELRRNKKVTQEQVANLIDYVLVYDNEHIEIRWNFDDFQAG